MLKYQEVSRLAPECLNDLNALWKTVSKKGELMTPQKLKRILRKGSQSRLFVCIDTEKDRIVGQVWVSIRETSSPMRADIDEVATLKKWERHGIATRLMDVAEAYALRKGVKKIELTSAPHRQRAIKFYLKRGYKIRKTNVIAKKLS